MARDGESTGAPEPAKLIARIAKQRDKEAFASLFGAFAPRIKALMLRGGATPELAEDIAQETLLVVWRKAQTYKPEKAGASTWIFTIARNLRIDRLRRDGPKKGQHLYEAVEPEEPQRPDSAVEDRQHEDRLREALKDLPEDQMQVLQMSFFDDDSHSEIAQKQDIPLGTVKSRLRLAIRKLRENLDDMS